MYVSHAEVMNFETIVLLSVHLLKLEGLHVLSVLSRGSEGLAYSTCMHESGLLGIISPMQKTDSSSFKCKIEFVVKFFGYL